MYVRHTEETGGTDNLCGASSLLLRFNALTENNLKSHTGTQGRLK